MRQRSLIFLLAFSLLVAPSFSKDKNRDWQTGNLVSIEEGAPKTLGMAVNPALIVPVEQKVYVYTIETEAAVYVFSEPGRGWHERPRPFTVGNQVKFAFDPKGNAFLIDESGKEFKAALVKKAGKQPTH